MDKKKPAAAAKPAAKPAAAKKPVASNGDSLPGGFDAGAKIKYNDGSTWVEGVIESTKPVRMALADNSSIEISPDVFREAIAVGIVAKR